MRPTVTISVRAQKLTAITARLKEAAGSQVAVGILGERAAARVDNNKGTQLTNVEVGIIHEFGAPKANIPERSFLRSTFAEEGPTVTKAAANAARKLYADEAGLEQRLGQIGAYLAGQVKVKITEGIDPPNAPSTVARKGSSTPLVDTGQLLTSITHQVRKVK